VDAPRVEEYRSPRASLLQRLRAGSQDVARWINARSRPSGAANARRLRARGESLESIVLRDATVADIPALAELHVVTWNATYRTSNGPTVATRARQWNEVLTRSDRRDFVLVLAEHDGRLIGFAWGKPAEGEFEGQLSKIFLRWEYHGVGLGRRMLVEVARRFHAHGIRSFVLFAERSNPTIGFYDRMGGERLRDACGIFSGAYGWRDVRVLIP
jgi:ribosomal protein S18 acetylase RimI-like enzyme